MGYTTYFTVARNDGEPFTPEQLEALDQLSVFNEETEEGDERVVALEGAAKWYDFVVDMKKFSRAFPKTVFKLHGEGEQNDDLWDAYFKDGKWQNCPADIIYPDYDEEKLDD